MMETSPNKYLTGVQSTLADMCNKTYAENCDYLQGILQDIINEQNISTDAMAVMAFILMEIPADFFSSYSKGLYQDVKKFLISLCTLKKEEFIECCRASKRYREDRVAAYLA